MSALARTIRIAGAAGILAVAACVSAVAAPRDPAPVFAEIDKAIEAHEFFTADDLLGELTNSLLAAKVPPLAGAGYRQAWDAGRSNPDLAALVQQARLTWAQAANNEQPWSKVMAELSTAESSAVALDAALPPEIRYRQARARYEASPSIIFLHQLMLCAFKAGDYPGTSKYIAELRIQIPRAYPPEWSGSILNRLETLAGIVELKAGNVAGAVAALARSGAALRQFPGRSLQQAPLMLLARELYRGGQSAPVLAYLDICAQYDYPGGEEFTDIGKNPASPIQLKAAILAGAEPQFGPGSLEIY